MGFLKEYFDQSFRDSLIIESKSTETIAGREVKYICNRALDFYTGVLYLGFYFDDDDLEESFFVNFLAWLKDNWIYAMGIVPNNSRVILPSRKSYDGEIQVSSQDQLLVNVKFRDNSVIKQTDLIFSGRILIFSNSNLSNDSVENVKNTALRNNFKILYRGAEYQKFMNTELKPLAFISHDSRDKDNIARPLSNLLQGKQCRVWYDEFSLKIGDSLRETIEKGLKNCDKCILILTPSFLSNSGWTKTEFNSIFTREILEDKKLVLPIWAGISKEEVYEYSPSLLNVVGLNLDNSSLEDIANKISLVLNEN